MNTAPTTPEDIEKLALAALLEPAADDCFRFAAFMAWNPARINVGGVDEVAALIGVFIEDTNRGSFIGGPTKDVAAEAERGNL